MKLLILVNEEFAEMSLGQNTTLAYILAGISLGFDVAIFDLSKDLLPQNSSAKITTTFLDKNSNSLQNLVKEFQLSNNKILELVKNKNFAELSKFKAPKVRDLLNEQPTKQEFLLSDFSKIIQRLEPMKKPFPPLGNEKIDDILLQLKALLPNKDFNFPVNLSDKQTPLKINKILKTNIATPTNEFTLKEKNIGEKLNFAVSFYQKIYQNNDAKIVIKPENSAQSLGVFAIDFKENGDDLKMLKQKTILEISQKQIYQIKQNLLIQDLEKIVVILCFVQNIKSDKNFNLNQKIEDVNFNKMTEIAFQLYNEKILVQPFIEGIKLGDVRANIIKDGENNFYCMGFTYRKSLGKDSTNFTTGYSTNKSMPLPIAYLTKFEQENLKNNTNKIIEILNKNLRQEYSKVTELGFDFLLVGDGENVLLGEINHHCIGLTTISEAMNKIDNQDSFYEGGLGFARKFIKELSF